MRTSLSGSSDSEETDDSSDNEAINPPPAKKARFHDFSPDLQEIPNGLFDETNENDLLDTVCAFFLSLRISFKSMDPIG